MTVRRAGGVLAALCVAVLLLVMGAALRPLLVPGSTPPPTVLSATEIAFVQDMTAHHQQALLLVQRLEPQADPMVLRLAQQIADTQRGEIGMMLGWLRLAGATVTDPHPMAWMHDGAEPSPAHQHSAAAAAPVNGLPIPAASGSTPAGRSTSTAAAEAIPVDMPGMASPAELDRLAHTTGPDATILFLRLMQRHHYGGIAMAQAADRILKSGVVKQAARDMITTQSQEAGLIGLLLDKTSGPPAR
ncbi:DUF305 domain-containing protein [Nocardia sp. alder85J]|uniref:DUF305 domain-containing protein n=1 Tax=Nocardia sp. alder85J TaxID=2862949 RepID=UPI001CD2DA0E|nr:DUF305 domain-containing protein [Nocardia sp. alder85J]MCX4092991.1 DUF305 domain-containing protein [Nocardia sp. alder85J]